MLVGIILILQKISELALSVFYYLVSRIVLILCKVAFDEEGWNKLWRFAQLLEF